MIQAVADTHAVIWHLFRDSRLSNPARSYIEQATFEGNCIAISTITFAEIIYLSERDRIPAETLPKLLKLIDSGASVWIEVPFNRAIARATAVHLEIPVITRR